MNTKTTSRLASGSETTRTPQAQLERTILAAITRRPTWEMGQITDPANGYVNAVLRDGEFTAMVGRTASCTGWRWQVKRGDQVLVGGQVTPSGPTRNMREAEKALADARAAAPAHPGQQLADELAAGFRALADLFESNPALAEYARHAQFDRVLVSANHCEQEPAVVLAEFVRAAKARGFKIAKTGSDKWFHTDLTSGPVGLSIFAAREEVCERVVTGTQTVTKTVKDPALLAAVPEVEVTETVEVVEWQCRPLLAAEAVQA